MIRHVFEWRILIHCSLFSVRALIKKNMNEHNIIIYYLEKAFEL